MVSKWLKDVRENPPTCLDEQHDARPAQEGHCSHLLTAQADAGEADALPWHRMIAESTVSHSQSIPQWKCPSIHFQSTHSCSQTLQRTGQWSNEWHCSGWINTPFSDIIAFVRDKGQVMVGPYVAGACSVLPKSIYLSPLIIWSLQRRKKGERLIFFLLLTTLYL